MASNAFNAGAEFFVKRLLYSNRAFAATPLLCPFCRGRLNTYYVDKLKAHKPPGRRGQVNAFLCLTDGKVLVGGMTD